MPAQPRSAATSIVRGGLGRIGDALRRRALRARSAQAASRRDVTGCDVVIASTAGALTLIGLAWLTPASFAGSSRGSVHAVRLVARASVQGSPPMARTPVQRQAYLMGTHCRLATYAADRREGLARLERMLRALEATNARLSTWREDTALAELNRQPVGQPAQLDSELCDLLRVLEHWRKRTGGAFDPAVGRLVEAWGLRSGGRTPDAAGVARARALSGLEHIVIDAGCRFTRTRPVILEEGAFGKGAALDRAAAAGDGSAWLVDLGGQVMAGAPPPGAHGWDVALAHPLQRGEPVLTVKLASGSLSTSGASERDVEAGGRRIGHLLDPRTGRPAAFAGSVTVWHEQALAADVLSTALYVMGPEAGLRWAENRGVAACFLTPRRAGGIEVVESRAFRALAH